VALSPIPIISHTYRFVIVCDAESHKKTLKSLSALLSLIIFFSLFILGLVFAFKVLPVLSRSNKQIKNSFISIIIFVAQYMCYLWYISHHLPFFSSLLAKIAGPPLVPPLEMSTIKVVSSV
jgi:preprotein translocase subunit SecE